MARRKNYVWAVRRGNLVVSRHKIKKTAKNAARLYKGETIQKIPEQRRKTIKKGSAFFTPFKLNF